MQRRPSTPVRTIIVAVVLATATLGLPSMMAQAAHGDGDDHATALLRNTSGAAVGRVNFTRVGEEDADDPDESTNGSDLIFIEAEIFASPGLEPGFHGLHIHDNMQGTVNGCVADPSTPTQPFSATDGHYNPEGSDHGHHAGDLPVLLVDGDRSALKVTATTAFSIEDITGRAVIVHSGQDNYAHVPDERDDGTGYDQNDGTGPVPDETTLDTGDAGARVACGEIVAEEGEQVRDPGAAETFTAVFTDATGAFVGFGFAIGTQDDDKLTVGANVDLLDPLGFHGFHLHAGNRCQFDAGSFDFTYAQGHYDNSEDGDVHPNHAGDLPPLRMLPETTTTIVDQDPSNDAATSFPIDGAFGADVTDRLSAGEASGRTLIVHGNPDNFANIPDERDDGTGYDQNDGTGPVPDEITLAGGDSGDRLACGMIEGLVRLAGRTRIDTAVEISQDSFLADDSAESVVLARADVFADALAGVPLAEAKGAPILLTWPDELTSETATELERVLPDGATVYLLGGEKALGADVADAIADRGFEPVRLSGPTRFNTAVNIADELDATHDTIFVTTGLRWPDAVSAGAAASQEDAVILFSQGDDPDPATDAYLADHDDEPVFAIGGPAARAYPDSTGVSGRERNETSVVVAERFFAAPAYVGLARDGEAGDDLDDRFADALTGGAHVGRLGGPMLLVDEDRMPESVRQYLQDNASAIAREYAYGGTAAISEAVATASEDAANETTDVEALSVDGSAWWRRFIR